MIIANYTEEVVDFIKKNYPEKGARFCAEELGFPFKLANITRYCNVHKIKKIDPYNGPVIDLEAFKNVTDPAIAYLLGY